MSELLNAVDAKSALIDSENLDDFFHVINNLDVGASAEKTTVLYTGDFAGQTTANW